MGGERFGQPLTMHSTNAYEDSSHIGRQYEKYNSAATTSFHFYVNSFNQHSNLLDRVLNSGLKRIDILGTGHGYIPLSNTFGRL
jgi:hypothetical protein